MEKVSFYFDEMMPRIPAEKIFELGYKVIMAVDVEMTEKTDAEHLAYATKHNYVLVTFDRKFAGISAKSTDHAGLICLSTQQNDYGTIIRTLEAFIEQYPVNEVKGQVFWL